MTGRKNTYDSIIIAGERYRLGGDVRVVTFEDRDAYPGTSARLSFERARSSPTNVLRSPLYGTRRGEEGKPVRNLTDLRATVHQVVLHTDLTTDSLKCFKVLVNRGLSTHFLIDWDGVIYQGLDVLDEAYHARDANNGSIGIDLNNLMENLLDEPGAPPYREQNPRFAEQSAKAYRRPKLPKGRINGGAVQSYGYTDPQYTALLELLKVLTKVLDRIKPEPPMDATGEIITNTLEGGSEFEGLVGHFHLTVGRWDPGPSFDWQRIYHGLAREHNAFPVEVEKGKNIATLLEPKKVKAYAEAYFEAIESHEGGGWYPMGVNQNWHGGVHVPAKRGAPVLAMFDGVVVAARFGARPTEVGHNNFVVLRHEIPIPTRHKDKTVPLVFYTLYMHLLPVDTRRGAEDQPEWLRAYHRADVQGEEDALALAEDEAVEDPTDDDEDDDDVLADDDGEEDEGAVDQGNPWLKLGSLDEGRLKLVAWNESPVRVASGEPIGQVGEFGPPDDWEPIVHVEIFADRSWKEAIDTGLHGAYLTELNPDFGRDLFVEDRAILSLFESSAAAQQRGSLVSARVLDPDDVEEFFTTPDDYVHEKRWLRKVVTRHVSEWSDRVDWVAALSRGEDWDEKIRDFRRLLRRSGVFRSALRQRLPFVWLTEEVAEHIGLDVEAWDGVLYHFHPIHFLMWLTYHSSQRIQVLSTGKSLKQIKAELKKEKRRIERLKAQGRYREEACELAAMDLDDLDFGATHEVLDDLFDAQGQGEWERVDPGED